MEEREIRGERTIVTLTVSDFTDTIHIKMFTRNEQLEDCLLYTSVQNFLNVSDLVDENYEVYTELAADGRFFLRLYCVRPAENLKLRLERGNSTIFFSATLLPVNYYKDLLTGEPDDYAVYAQSPFYVEKRALLIWTCLLYTSRCV